MRRKTTKSIVSIPADLCKIPEESRSRREGKGFQQTTVGWTDCPPFLGYRITSAGITQASSEFAVSNILQDGWVVMAVIEGCGAAWCDGAWQPWTVDTALVLPPHAWHHYRGQSARWRFCWVVYRANDDLTLPAAPELRPFPAAPFAASIDGCYRERAMAHAHEAQHHWAALVDLLARRTLTDAQDHRLDAVWQAVLEDPAQRWTLGDLARIAGMSIEALRVAVHHAFGRSPMAHCTWLRMHHAASLLTLGDDRVAKIADDVGYDNPFAFSVAFKRVLGISPAMYRGQRRGQHVVPGDPQGRPPSRGGRGVTLRHT
jgi:AraC-like DNA-binding protein